MISLWHAFQDEIRKNGRHGSVRVADLIDELHCVLRCEPWEDGDVHDLYYHQLHLLAYPDPETRPERLDIMGKIAGKWHNQLIEDYERERQAG